MNYKSMIFFLQIKSPAEYMGTVEMSSQILLAGTFNPITTRVATPQMWIAPTHDLKMFQRAIFMITCVG